MTISKKTTIFILDYKFENNLIEIVDRNLISVYSYFFILPSLYLAYTFGFIEILMGTVHFCTNPFKPEKKSEKESDGTVGNVEDELYFKNTYKTYY